MVRRCGIHPTRPMTKLNRTLLLLALAAPLSGAVTSHAGAQERPAGPTVTATLGVMEFDLSGVDVTQEWALRFDAPVLGRAWRAEAGVAWSETIQQADTVAVLVPEAMLQGELAVGWFSPFVGLGAGLFIENPKDEQYETSNAFAYVGALGIRARLAGGLGARVEGRVRGIEPRVTGSTTTVSAGLSYTF